MSERSDWRYVHVEEQGDLGIVTCLKTGHKSYVKRLAIDRFRYLGSTEDGNFGKAVAASGDFDWKRAARAL